MSDDTGTDWAAEADKAEAGLSRVAHHPDDAILFVGGDNTSTITLGQARAAAVGLRRLAQLDTAIGDPGNLRLLADTFDLPILRRIADAAVLGSGEQPEGPTTCPNPECEDGRIRPSGNCGFDDDGALLDIPCPDSWHGEQR